MQQSSRPQKYNEELQAVRAIAICMVLVSHASALFPWNNAHWQQVGQGFYIGVDLFLCLSGYVISKGVAQNLLTLSGNAFWRETAAFWVRRLYRITPSAWLWLFFPLICYSIANGHISRNDLSDAVAVLVHVANFRNYECAWITKQCGGFGPYWSLSLEEQFYLLLPFLFLIFRRRIHYALFALVLVQLFIPRAPGANVLGAMKTDALMLGVLLALWSETASYRIFDPSLTSSRLRFVVPPILVGCMIGLARYEPVPFFIGMVAIVSALIIWLCSYDRGYFIPSGVVRRCMVWVGERSFAIYLIHPFAYWATNIGMRTLYPDTQFAGNYTLRFALSAILLTLVCAEFNYRFVEKPLRRRGVQRAEAIKAAAERPDSTPRAAA
jgi:peptidoglycan/LPS O-acetylase OafA/YrhL